MRAARGDDLLEAGKRESGLATWEVLARLSCNQVVATFSDVFDFSSFAGTVVPRRQSPQSE